MLSGMNASEVEQPEDTRNPTLQTLQWNPGMHLLNPDASMEAATVCGQARHLLSCGLGVATVKTRPRKAKVPREDRLPLFQDCRAH